MPVKVYDFGFPANEATLFLPGILGKAENYFFPIANLFPGRHIGIDDVGTSYDHDDMVEKVLNELFRFYTRNQSVTMVGASIGGMKIPFVIEQFRQLYPSYSLDFIKRIVIIDAPSGAETLVPLPDWSSGFVESRAGILISPLSKIIVAPKDSEITYPGPRALQRMTDDDRLPEAEWRELVKRTAKYHLRGYSMRLWWSWMSWMIKVGRDGSLARACASLEHVKTVYVACTHEGNVTVDQPRALEWFAEHVPDLHVMSVNAVHCGFLQQQPEFEEVLRPALTI